MPDVHFLVNEFVARLEKRKIERSVATAKLTAQLLRSFISQQRLPHSNQAGTLIDAVKTVGAKLIDANPIELAVGNVVRRVLHIIREEEVGGLSLSAESDDEDDAKDDDHPVLLASAVAAAARSVLRAPSLHTLLEDMPQPASGHCTSSSGGDSEEKCKSVDKNPMTRKLKHNVIKAVNELIQEISSCHEQISEQAVEHIHQKQFKDSNGVSMRCKGEEEAIPCVCRRGCSKISRACFCKRTGCKGTDSAIFAMISRVTMVIVGAHAIMANGGIIAPVGHAVPFVVLAGPHKLCPLYPHNPEVFLNELNSSSDLLDFGEFSDCLGYGSGTGSPLLHVVNPAFDYVPPNLVSLFITDTGGHNPSYIYRPIADYYSADDLVLRRKSAS